MYLPVALQEVEMPKPSSLERARVAIGQRSRVRLQRAQAVPSVEGA
jgi:hypothetical protein